MSTMYFAEATIMRMQAKEEADTFTKACAEQEDEMKDELDGILGIFKNVLSAGNADAIQLMDGSFLYMKTNSSTRALNEERLGTAVDNITFSQLKRVLTSMENATLVQVLCACVEENLEDECIRVSYTPSVAKRRPTGMDASIAARPATDAIERAVDSYWRLKKQLAELRKHRSLGRKRVTEVAEQTEPVIRAYMDQKEVAKQRVRLIGRPATPSTPPSPPMTIATSLPPMPVLLPAHAEEDRRRADTTEEPPSKRIKTEPPVTLMVDEATVQPRIIEFKKRTYTSRGKAPRLREFAELMPDRIIEIIGDDSMSSPTDAQLKKWATKENKKKLLSSLLEQYNTLYEATKGKTTEKLSIRAL